MNTQQLLHQLRKTSAPAARPAARPAPARGGTFVDALFKRSMEEFGGETAGMPETITEEELAARAASAEPGPPVSGDGGMAETQKSSTPFFIAELLASRL